MTSPNDKGRELEDAVRAIEQTILEARPELREQRFLIESRKRVEVDGVHHEIDILVTVGLATGYEATFLFECKNWESPVGKNEVIILSGKIADLGAQRGFLIAPSFTRDAEAQARKDKRLELLRTTQHSAAAAVPAYDFHFVERASTKCDVIMRLAGTAGKNRARVEICGKPIKLHGNEVALEAYLGAWLDQEYQGRLRRFQTADLPEDVYPMALSSERRFAEGELSFEGVDIEQLRIEVEFGVRVVRPPVISDYEVATRGRVTRFGETRLSNCVVDVEFVTLGSRTADAVIEGSTDKLGE